MKNKVNEDTLTPRLGIAWKSVAIATHKIIDTKCLYIMTIWLVCVCECVNVLYTNMHLSLVMV